MTTNYKPGDACVVRPSDSLLSQIFEGIEIKIKSVHTLWYKCELSNGTIIHLTDDDLCKKEVSATLEKE